MPRSAADPRVWKGNSKQMGRRGATQNQHRGGGGEVRETEGCSGAGPPPQVALLAAVQVLKSAVEAQQTGLRDWGGGRGSCREGRGVRWGRGQLDAGGAEEAFPAPSSSLRNWGTKSDLLHLNLGIPKPWNPAPPQTWTLGAPSRDHSRISGARLPTPPPCPLLPAPRAPLTARLPSEAVGVGDLAGAARAHGRAVDQICTPLHPRTGARLRTPRGQGQMLGREPASEQRPRAGSDAPGRRPGQRGRGQAAGAPRGPEVEVGAGEAGRDRSHPGSHTPPGAPPPDSQAGLSRCLRVRLGPQTFFLCRRNPGPSGKGVVGGKGAAPLAPGLELPRPGHPPQAGGRR